MLPVSWQMGWDLFLASAIFWSIIFIALSAMVPFFSCSKDSTIALCTSSGISVEARRTSSNNESDNDFIRRQVRNAGSQSQFSLRDKGKKIVTLEQTCRDFTCAFVRSLDS